jgi:hypothetical protein
VELPKIMVATKNQPNVQSEIHGRNGLPRSNIVFQNIKLKKAAQMHDQTPTFPVSH